MTKTFKQVREMNINPDDKEEITASKKIPKGYHRMPDGTLMKDSDHPKKEEELEELSQAQITQRRLNRKTASLRKTMAKNRAASQAGIHPSRVNQRRNKLTVKK